MVDVRSDAFLGVAKDALAFVLVVPICPVAALPQEVQAVQVVLEFEQDGEATSELWRDLGQPRIQAELLR